MKIWKFFCYKEEAITCNPQFAVSKDDWNTKESTGKSMKNVLLYTMGYAKRHLSGLRNIKL